MADKNDNLNKSFEKNHEALNELIESNERLRESVYSDTSIDTLNKLTEKVNKKNEELEKIITAVNNNNSLNISMSNITEGLKSLEEKIKKQQDKVNEAKNSLKENNQNLEKEKSILQSLIDKRVILKDKEKTLKEEIEELSKRRGELSEEEKEHLEDIEAQLEKNKEKYQEIEEQIANTHDSINDLTEEQIIYNNTLETQSETLNNLKEDYDDLYNGVNDHLTEANNLQKELNRRQEEGRTILDDFGDKVERNTRAFSKGYKDISSGFKGIADGTNKIFEPWRKANQEAMSYARTMGMSQKTADQFLSTTVSWAAENNIGLLYNKTTDELIKMQGKYSEVVGRNVQLTDKQKESMLALETIMGEEGMVDIANNLENFGMGMSDTADFIHKTYNEATKQGIVASKLTKTIRDNIKMAQSYSFKNGLDGLTNMAKKAIQLKTDMSLVNGFIDKVSTVEGAITTGAQLQVLGGAYAMGSDPISMLHDSLNNVEGLFDKAVGMAQGKVFYNSQTGNFEMGAMDRYMMKQAATTMGIDPGKLIDVAFRQASLDKIEGQAKANSKISNDKDMIELVKNVATWSNGEAVVNINGKDKKVSELDKQDKEILEQMQRTDSQNLQEMAINLRSMNEIMSGVTKEASNEQANTTASIAQSLNNLLRNNTVVLDRVAKMMSWTTIFSGIFGVVGGIWATMKGVGSLNQGFKNLASGAKKGFKNGGFKGAAKNIFSNVGKTIASRTPMAIGGGIAGGAISLASDMITGDFKKDVGGSFGRAGGTAVGAAIGAFFGPIGSMIGGWIGSVATEAIQQKQKESRAKLRQEIAASFSIKSPQLASLFEGENALEGNYNKKDLQKLAEALKDNKIDDSDDLGFFLKRKLKNNNDLIKIAKSGVDVGIEMANGGVINKNMISSSNILSSNTSSTIANSNVSSASSNINSHSITEYANGGIINSSKLASSKNTVNNNQREYANGGIINSLSTKNSKNVVVNNNQREYANGGIISTKSSTNSTSTSSSMGGVFNNIQNEYANGGMLVGKSHAEGGMPILGSNIFVEGGEYVINKKATKENFALLERINTGDYKMTAKEPLGKQMKVEHHNTSSDGYSMPHNSRVDIPPISINLSGTIKLDGGNKQVDISNEILNNPLLISKLTEMINKQLNILDNGAYNKSIFKQKFI